ncbi:MAG: transcription termination/antitermination protein NusA [Clostridia bacterium]|nr:transcription termination/antitermination protein NusA [Clostridia bacterium]
MNSELFDALDEIERIKCIPKDYMLEKLQAALQSALKKEQGADAIVSVVADAEKKEFRVYRAYNIVDEVVNPENEVTYEQAKKLNRHCKKEGPVTVEVHPDTFRRLSAQSGKSIIIQAIREAERSNILREYEKRTDSVISATVMRIDPDTGNVVVDTGTSVARILKSDLIPTDNFTEGQKIKVCVTEIRKDATAGPLVTLSRIHPDFIRRLFELEIPEISDETVEIKSIAREPGSRTKVAVWSNDPDVDAVGACIGKNSARINNILRELSGEKIDLVRYSDDPLQYIASALAPAKCREVFMIDSENEGGKEMWKGTARAIVRDEQLSLAIGAQGQNVRLAAKLTGYRIDIKTVVSVEF